MKVFDDKYIHSQEALTRPELAPVWLNGYDILMYVENIVLTASPDPAGGNRFNLEGNMHWGKHQYTHAIHHRGYLWLRL